MSTTPTSRHSGHTPMGLTNYQAPLNAQRTITKKRQKTRKTAKDVKNALVKQIYYIFAQRQQYYLRKSYLLRDFWRHKQPLLLLGVGCSRFKYKNIPPGIEYKFPKIPRYQNSVKGFEYLDYLT